MTEKNTGEPTPTDYNNQLKRIYRQIPEGSVGVEYDWDAFAFAGTRFLVEDHFMGMDIDDIEIKGPITSNKEYERKMEIEERFNSPDLRILWNEMEDLLRHHSSLSIPAKKVALIQFISDYLDGRRLGDKIVNATTIRIPRFLFLELENSEGEGVFSHDGDKVKEIEREMYGAYLDWVEIRMAGPDIVSATEVDLLHEWRREFRVKYGEPPYANLEPKEEPQEPSIF